MLHCELAITLFVFFIADIEAVIANAFAVRERVQRFNPFLRSRHSDTASSLSESLARSPNAARAARIAFKRLQRTTAWSWTMLKYMFGQVHRFDAVTLAHVWPKALLDVAPSLEDKEALALPLDFYNSPRNYLLLDRQLTMPSMMAALLLFLLGGPLPFTSFGQLVQ